MLNNKKYVAAFILIEVLINKISYFQDTCCQIKIVIICHYLILSAQK